MARIEKIGYGQLELNNAGFRRSGRIEAQCALDATDFAEVPAENGMLLAVDNITRTVKFVKEGNKFPVALHYSAEHGHDAAKAGLKDFCLKVGGVLPRLGYLGAGDKYTTNCVAYEGYENEAAFWTALAEMDAPLYAVAGADGYHVVAAANTADKAVAMVIGATTMPDGQKAVKFQAL